MPTEWQGEPLLITVSIVPAFIRDVSEETAIQALGSVALVAAKKAIAEREGVIE